MPDHHRTLLTTATCSRCTAVTQAVWLVDDLDDSGERVIQRVTDDVPHPAEVCDRVYRCKDEEWPVRAVRTVAV